MKSLNDEALAPLLKAYEESVRRSEELRDRSLSEVAVAMVDLLEAAEYDMNDMGELLAVVGASDSMAGAAYREWDNRHPGSARQALEDLLTGTWVSRAAR